MKKIYFFIMVSLIALTVHAQLVMNENFTDCANGNLNGQKRWESFNTGNDVIVSNVSPLAYSTYCGGKYISIKSISGKDPHKPFSAPVKTTANKTIFLRFAVRVNEVNENYGPITLVLRDSNSLTPYIPCRFYTHEEAGPSQKLQFGIAAGSDDASFTTTAGSWVKGNTYLIVIRYDIVTDGPDRAYLWVNPSTAAEPITSASNTASFALSTTGELPYGPEWNVLQLFQSGINAPDADFDEFQVAEGATSPIAWSYLPPIDLPIAASQNFGISLWPNPVSHILTIQYPKVVNEGHIQILSAYGTLIKDLRLPATAATSTIDVSGFASGLYHVVFISDSRVYTKRFLKQ
jgi:hypothetical protein